MFDRITVSEPERPAWFTRALAVPCEEWQVEVRGTSLEVITWGERGRPGILFLHGNGAHAQWWNFIAPFFSDAFRCAALSWGGMGRSGWRTAYSPELFVEEAIEVARAAGLYDEGAPTIIAHSFGGLPSMKVAGDHPEKLSGLIIIDTPLYDRSTIANMPQLRLRENPVYPQRGAALERFRLMPPNAKANEYILDYLASTSVMECEGGWTWQFDPFLWRDTSFRPDIELVRDVSCRFAYIYGELSELTGPATAAAIQHRNPAATVIAIPDAGHHVMVDQPLALIAALRSVIACW